MNRCLMVACLSVLLCAAPAAADPPAEIDYQGRISIGQRPLTGTGYFKYAITDAAESVSRWSNDGSAAGEPAGSCAQAVNGGRFSALLGAPPMSPIDPAALASDDACFLRVWFSQDGVAFQELKPKQKLVSSPFAVNALRLGGKSRDYFEDAAHLAAGSVPDERLGAAVTKLGASIGAGEIEQGAVGTREIADGSVQLEDLNLSSLDARFAQKVGDEVAGPLHVAGAARFEAGILFIAPLGDLLMGIYTNSP